MQTPSTERVEVIPLINRGSLLTTYLKVYNRPLDDGHWHIVNIEIYADAEHQRLIGEDFQPEDFGVWAARDFYETLSEVRAERDERAQELRRTLLDIAQEAGV